MDRRTLLLGLLGGLAAAPTIIAAASSAEAAPLPEVLPPSSEPLPEAASPRPSRKPIWRGSTRTGASTGGVAAVVSIAASTVAPTVASTAVGASTVASEDLGGRGLRLSRSHRVLDPRGILSGLCLFADSGTLEPLSGWPHYDNREDG
jgi:hypothetical protein